MRGFEQNNYIRANAARTLKCYERLSDQFRFLINLFKSGDPFKSALVYPFVPDL